jgi:hypothetical protein
MPIMIMAIDAACRTHHSAYVANLLSKLWPRLRWPCSRQLAATARWWKQYAGHQRVQKTWHIPVQQQA